MGSSARSRPPSAASVPAEELVAPEDGPVELLASVNGAVLHLRAEQVRRERQFG
jgi:hypothetical protein